MPSEHHHTPAPQLCMSNRFAYSTLLVWLQPTGETKIGISYEKLCQSLKPGNVVKMADGSLSVEVLEILNDKELKAR